MIYLLAIVFIIAVVLPTVITLGLLFLGIVKAVLIALAVTIIVHALLLKYAHKL